jgi:hypothetical protein
LASKIPQQVKHSSVLVRLCNGAEVDPNTLAVFSGGQQVEGREKDAALQTAVHLAFRAASKYVIAVPVYHLRSGVAQESLRALVPGDNSLFSIGGERTIRCVP